MNRMGPQGDMATLIAEKDWSQTQLGPREGWPLVLRYTLNLILQNKFPMAILWGEELRFLYNDEYAKIAGSKHPSALGASTREIWPEVWSINQPIFDAVMTRGESVYLENQLFPIFRKGVLEESFFTLCYSPIYCDDYTIGGTLVTLVETTQQVLANRRVGILSKLTSYMARSKKFDAAILGATDALGESTSDFPFSLIYRIDELARVARLLSCTGVAPGSDVSPAVVCFEESHSLPWDFQTLVQNKLDFSEVDLTRFSSVLPKGFGGEPVRRALILSLLAPNESHLGFLVLGVSVAHELNDDLKNFAREVAQKIEDSISIAIEIEASLNESQEDSRERAEELNAIMDAMPALTFIAHDTEGRSMTSSRFVHELLRIPAGGNTSLSAPELERPRSFRALKDGRELRPEELPVQRSAATGEKIFDSELVLELDDGEQISIFGNAVPLLGKDGKPRGAVGAFLNISQLKKAELEIRNSEAFLQTILENVPAGIWYVNASGKIVYTNPAASKIWGGIRYVDVDGFGEYKAWWVESGNRIEPHDWAAARAIEKGEVSLNEVIEIECFDGTHKIVHNSGMPIRLSDGTISGAVVILEDITTLRQAEMERHRYQTLQSIGVVAGGIAHDFNNIMMGLFGSISVAKNEISRDHPFYKSMEDAEKSLNRAIGLTKQLLTFSKGGDPVKSIVELSALIDDVIRFDLSGSNVKAVFEHANELWKVNADGAQLQQVISNIAINAREAMPRGGVLRVSTRNLEIAQQAAAGVQPGAYVQVIIKDEGVGIDAKNLPNIFDPYFSTKSSGRGLGLATAYSIIVKHGGRISATSQLGEGTTFTILIPACAVSPSKDVEAREKDLSQTFSGKRVLVLDDEEIIRTVVPRWLKNDNWEVTAVSDGKSAVEAYLLALGEGKPFDVLLLDLTIPGGMGGVDVLKVLQSLHSGVRAVVSSGYADDSVLANFAEFGFSGAIAKPYTAEMLRTAMILALAQTDKAEKL